MDVTWHDGQPFTARDVTFTFDAIRKTDAAPPLKARLAAVTAFSAPDDRTVVVAFSRSACPLLSEVGQIPILPRHLLEGKELTDTGYNTQAVGTGPFRFGQRDASGEVHLLRNDHYFLGAPHFNEWVYRPISDTVALQAALKSGDVDLAAISPADAAGLEKEASLRLLAYSQPEYDAVILNTIQPALADVRVRYALSDAIDRRKLLDETLGGRGTLIDGPLLAWPTGPIRLRPRPTTTIPLGRDSFLRRPVGKTLTATGCWKRTAPPLRVG